jgi:hypothetical protein
MKSATARSPGLRQGRERMVYGGVQFYPMSGLSGQPPGLEPVTSSCGCWMSLRRPFIPQRTPIFVGCEGESERSYVKLLQGIADGQLLSLHLDAVVLQPGGGDPCAIVELALRKLNAKRRIRGNTYRAKIVLLDDERGNLPQRDARAIALAKEGDLQLFWQSPCHEAVLLRHLEHCTTLRPPTTALAQAALRERWPAYDKPPPMTSQCPLHS